MQETLLADWQHYAGWCCQMDCTSTRCLEDAIFCTSSRGAVQQWTYKRPRACTGALDILSRILAQVLVNYSAAEVIWVQEEPENQGAWRYVKPRLDTAMRELLPRSGPHARPPELCTLRYVGRPAAATPGAALLVTRHACYSNGME